MMRREVLPNDYNCHFNVQCNMFSNQNNNKEQLKLKKQSLKNKSMKFNYHPGQKESKCSKIMQKKSLKKIPAFEIPVNKYVPQPNSYEVHVNTSHQVLQNNALNYNHNAKPVRINLISDHFQQKGVSNKETELQLSSNYNTHHILFKQSNNNLKSNQKNQRCYNSPNQSIYSQNNLQRHQNSIKSSEIRSFYTIHTQQQLKKEVFSSATKMFSRDSQKINDDKLQKKIYFENKLQEDSEEVLDNSLNKSNSTMVLRKTMELKQNSQKQKDRFIFASQNMNSNSKFSQPDHCKKFSDSVKSQKCQKFGQKLDLNRSLTLTNLKNGLKNMQDVEEVQSLKDKDNMSVSSKESQVLAKFNTYNPDKEVTLFNQMQVFKQQNHAKPKSSKRLNRHQTYKY